MILDDIHRAVNTAGAASWSLPISSEAAEIIASCQEAGNLGCRRRIDHDRQRSEASVLPAWRRGLKLFRCPPHANGRGNAGEKRRHPGDLGDEASRKELIDAVSIARGIWRDRYRE